MNLLRINRSIGSYIDPDFLLSDPVVSLSDYTYSVIISCDIYLAAWIVLLMMAIMIISRATLKAARSQPIKELRS